jgi:hypothetical protein
MPITEDKVKKAVEGWLENRGFKEVKARLGTEKGHDVEGVSPVSGKKLVVECKGETDAPNQWDRAWRNACYALFDSIKGIENPQNVDEVAMALPDTENYRKRMQGLQAFCKRQRIAVYWVSEDDMVQPWSDDGSAETDPVAASEKIEWRQPGLSNLARPT